MPLSYHVYIVASVSRVLYVGMTNDPSCVACTNTRTTQSMGSRRNIVAPGWFISKKAVM